MAREQDLSIEELSEQIADAILADPYFDKPSIKIKLKVLLLGYMKVKNTPKNYNQYVSPKKEAIRLRTIEVRQFQMRYWYELVLKLDPENIEKYYKELDQLMINEGYK